MKQVPFLMYHELETQGRTVCNDDPGYMRYVLDAAVFRQHLSRLRADGVRGVSVGGALASFDDVTPKIAMTFDDGCETDLTLAAPMLKDAGFGATFYVTVEHLGRRGYLTETQLKELSDLGFEIGSHAMTHRFLHDLGTAEVREELAGSKRTLEDLTGRPVVHFSCPGGRWDRRVSEEARRAGYDSLVTSAIGMNSKRTDRFRLTRVAVLRGMSANEVAHVSRGRGLLKRRAKSAVLDAAKTLLGNRRYERLRAAALSARP